LIPQRIATLSTPVARQKTPHDGKAPPTTDKPRVSASASQWRPTRLQLGFAVATLFLVRGAGASKLPTLDSVVSDMFEAGVSIMMNSHRKGYDGLVRVVEDSVFQGLLNSDKDAVHRGFDHFYASDSELTDSMLRSSPQGDVTVHTYGLNLRKKDSPHWRLLIEGSDKPTFVELPIEFAFGISRGPGQLALPWQPREVTIRASANDLHIGAFHELQNTAPTLFVLGGDLWRDRYRNLAFDRFFAPEGYAIGEFPITDETGETRNATVVAPPLSGVIEKFKGYGGGGWGQRIMSRVPAEREQAVFWRKRHSQSETIYWMCVGVAAAAASAADLSMQVCKSRPKPKPAPARPKPDKAAQKQAARDLGRQKHPSAPARSTESKLYSAPAPHETKQASAHPLREPGEIFREDQGTLKAMAPEDRLEQVRAMGAQAASELAQGFPARASERLRAILRVESNPVHAARLLTDGFGVAAQDILEALEYACEDDPHNTALSNELDALRERSQFINLVNPSTDDHLGDEKGRTGPRQRLPVQSTGTAAPARPMTLASDPPQLRSLAEAYHFAKSLIDSGAMKGAFEFKDGAWHAYVPGTTYPHLHLTTSFATLSKAHNDHLYLFDPGGDYRPATMPNAQYSLRDEDSQRVLRFIEGRDDEHALHGEFA